MVACPRPRCSGFVLWRLPRVRWLYYRTVMTAEPKRPIEATVENLEKLLDKRPIVWVGAGASIAAGYPSTWTLMQALEREAADDIDLDGDYTRIVDAFIASEGRGALRNLLHKQFVDVRQPTAVHRAIARLARCGKVAAVVTTNYDELVEDVRRRGGCPLGMGIGRDREDELRASLTGAGPGRQGEHGQGGEFIATTSSSPPPLPSAIEVAPLRPTSPDTSGWLCSRHEARVG